MDSLDDIDATDITIQTLKENKDFERADKSVTTRFSTPLHWTVENYTVPSRTEGIRNGLDKYPGFDCLTLGVWDDKENSEDGDLTNARVYQKVKLEAGTYYFGGIFNTIYNLNQAYFFVSADTLGTYDIESQSIAWYDISQCKADNQYWGVYFTLDQDQEVLLGIQSDLAGGANAQEFRISQITLLRYGMSTGIEDIMDSTSDAWDATLPVRYYSITGMELSKAPAHGFFIIRQGKNARKVFIP